MLEGFCYFFIALTVLLAIVTVKIRLSGNGVLYFILKCFTSSMFVFVAILGSLKTEVSKELIQFIIAGLLFGFLGDAILGAKEINKDMNKKPLIIAGIIAFLIGHIIFSVGFILKAGVNTYVFIIPLVLAIFALIVFLVLKYTVKAPVFVLLTVYAFFEVLMSASSGYLMINTNNPGFIVAFVGSISFCISDFVLSYVYFGPNKSKKNMLVFIELSTYYLAQILIAASVIFM